MGDAHCAPADGSRDRGACGVERAGHRDDGAPGKHHVAVFDFDGTSVNGNSPVLLVWYLTKLRMLPASTIARIMGWGVRYKLRLPQNEAWVRGLVFSAFEGKPVREVDAFLMEFYDKKIDALFRPEAEAAMLDHRAAGDTVLVVSASFEPIVQRAMRFRPIDGQTSTRMKATERGLYTCEVDGLPVEGAEKPQAIQRWCDARFGAGAWELTYAYGDHHSDRPMLAAARHAFAVDPDRPLRRTARSQGWTVLDWGPKTPARRR